MPRSITSRPAFPHARRHLCERRHSSVSPMAAGRHHGSAPLPRRLWGHEARPAGGVAGLARRLPGRAPLRRQGHRRGARIGAEGAAGPGATVAVLARHVTRDPPHPPRPFTERVRERRAGKRCPTSSYVCIRALTVRCSIDGPCQGRPAHTQDCLPARPDRPCVPLTPVRAGHHPIVPALALPDRGVAAHPSKVCTLPRHALTPPPAEF
jgi:hypothetical protein